MLREIPWKYILLRKMKYAYVERTETNRYVEKISKSGIDD